MRITIVKWVSIGLLLLALLFWSSFSQYGLTVELFVGFAAALVGLQAFRDKKGGWAAAFLLITVYFGAAAAASLMNPASPAVRLGGAAGALVIVFSIAAFALSFFALKDRPRMSIASITDRNPGSEAL